jgi:hypothetical protein
MSAKEVNEFLNLVVFAQQELIGFDFRVLLASVLLTVTESG